MNHTLYMLGNKAYVILCYMFCLLHFLCIFIKGANNFGAHCTCRTTPKKHNYGD